MDQEKALKALVKACASMSPELTQIYNDLMTEENPPSEEKKEGEEETKQENQ